jgi:hypothetical protein
MWERTANGGNERGRRGERCIGAGGGGRGRGGGRFGRRRGEEREKVGGGFKSNPALSSARAGREMRGKRRRRGREVRARSGGATWSGEGGGVADSAAVAGGGGRLEEGDGLTGGPHLSASRREGKGNGPAQTKEAERGREWADGPIEKKEGKEK